MHSYIVLLGRFPERIQQVQHLASQVDGRQEDVFGVVLQRRVGEEETLQEKHSCCLDLVGKTKGTTHFLNFAGIVLEQRSLLCQARRPGLLACSEQAALLSMVKRKGTHSCLWKL